MQIGSSFDSEDDYYYDDEEKDEEEANKVPMDKFGWFYKVCTIISKSVYIHLLISEKWHQLV